MKHTPLVGLLLLCLTFTMCKKTPKQSTLPVLETFFVPANKAYAEPYTPDEKGVRIPVGWVETVDTVTNWIDQNKSVVWYIYQKKGEYDLFYDFTVQANTTLDFELNVSSCYELGFMPVKEMISFKGTGQGDTLFCANINIVEDGYYRYELKPISDPKGLITINSLLFNSLKEGGHVNHLNYQSTASVHLSFSSTAPTTKEYSWLYQEILVPEGGDPLATFYMSLGFYRGYLGIQTNSDTERRVLFSVWDSKDAENDDSIEDTDYVTLVDAAQETTTNSFGGEGTGGQSFVTSANWETGKPVQFLMNVLPSTNNSVVLSAWYAVEKDNWKYIASWRAPKEQRLFDGFYSFIENFGFPNGQMRREAYYYNAWGLEPSGKWINFNKVRFSHTDGALGQRVDFEQGVSPEHPDRFYMAAGGYTPTIKTANEMPLSDKAPNIDLKPFIERINQALTVEKERSSNQK